MRAWAPWNNSSRKPHYIPSRSRTCDSVTRKRYPSASQIGGLQASPKFDLPQPVGLITRRSLVRIQPPLLRSAQTDAFLLPSQRPRIGTHNPQVVGSDLVPSTYAPTPVSFSSDQGFWPGQVTLLSQSDPSSTGGGCSFESLRVQLTIQVCLGKMVSRVSPVQCARTPQHGRVLRYRLR
jgi:hypothetical protein